MREDEREGGVSWIKGSRSPERENGFLEERFERFVGIIFSLTAWLNPLMIILLLASILEGPAEKMQRVRG
jgi:hypothetical protein